MTKYLLDTDHISFLQRRSGSEFQNLTRRMANYSINDFALSVISLHEQVIGANSFINRSQTDIELGRGYQLLQEILISFSKSLILPFDTKAITQFNDLRTQKVRVATMDLRIAAIALSNNLILLTRNNRDFSKVPALVTEDWTVNY
ncbi:MAG: type II toxin-antitoxin system VapC family toxin [Microcystaceae cyanobacterium]